MKWGVRRTKEQLGYRISERKAKNKAYREKMAKIANNRNVNAGDQKRARYASQTTSKKISSITTQVVLTNAIGKALSKQQTPMNPKVEAAKIASQIALNYTKAELLSKSTSKKYNQAGRRIERKGLDILSREDVYDVAFNTAMRAGVYASAIGALKYSDAKRNRAANEAKFQAWGGNILESKFDDIVGAKDDEWRIIG